jgi:hypothetical protein
MSNLPAAQSTCSPTNESPPKPRKDHKVPVLEASQRREVQGLYLGKRRVHHDASPIHPKVILPAFGAANFRG